MHSAFNLLLPPPIWLSVCDDRLCLTAAPCSRNRCSALSLVSHTTSLRPAARRLVAIRLPICPRPTNPTDWGVCVDVAADDDDDDDDDGRDCECHRDDMRRRRSARRLVIVSGGSLLLLGTITTTMDGCASPSVAFCSINQSVTES